ncbi:uncharacterized protein LOC132266482 [Cornus florida]|uniref:uncharacterized protein LOC132266482 n=1 Tax=Cornus florida TaxID=4283 RepID=UPI002898BF1C|nr:uncharacterized protein LOC132266482 [Cornus florida]XP_059623344.1 uncharacterized protein LOC132266482 [Cornus florida]
MEANLCDINHLDSDVLLPPRKRLLAGLKKQNSNGNSHLLPLTSATSNEFDTRLNNLLRSHLKNPNLSPEEMVESSRSAAVAAGKVAVSARAVADEKAEKAAKAVAAAKGALELVATISENTDCRERNSRKNKMKKHVQVEMLYTKHRSVENCKTDEELARKLHRAINSSPRISKFSSTSDLNSHKRKRLKNVPISEKTRISNGVTVWEGSPPSTSNGNGLAGEVDSEGSVHELYATRVDESTPKFNKADRLKIDSEEVESSHSKERIGESLDDISSNCRKRGRLKQKKLPLSICTFRDRENPKEELKSRSSPLTEESMPKTTASKMPLFPVEPSGDGVMPVETTTVWKCQAFKAPTCVKQNKVMQS